MYRALSLPRLSTLHVSFPAHLAAFVLPRLEPHTEALQLSPVPANATAELVAFLLRCYDRGTRVLLLESEDEVGFDAVKQAFSIRRYEFEGRYTRVVLSGSTPVHTPRGSVSTTQTQGSSTASAPSVSPQPPSP